ncbi:MAG: transcription termination factor NusA [Candidatus Moranbacteria bacterium]|nr:transcription termination factor NusA [Candidatus Moranbacteria bacterium]
MAKKKVEEVEESGSFSERLGEFGGAVMQLAEEKGISKDKILEIVGASLAAAYKKDYGKRGQVIVGEFDEVSKEAKYFLVKEVVDETTREFVEAPEEELEEMADASVEGDEKRLPRYNEERDITLEDAQKLKKDAVLGDTVRIELESHDEFGRVAAQTAKQVIIQRIREAERESMFAEYKEKEGQVVNGVVQRIEGRLVFIDLGKSVGVLFPAEQIEGENYRIGQRLKVFILKVESDAKGPGITLSRSHADIVRNLFALEVPEIFSGTVIIKGIAREAGSRTKIAVTASDESIDPIGSCVGQKGTRVQAVIDELGGEKIDIILWNEDDEKFIRAALSPAKVLSVSLNEELHEARVTVPDDQLSLAIGKRGQNVRLAVKLTGWKLDIVSAGAAAPAAEVTPEAVESALAEVTEVALAAEETVEEVKKTVKKKAVKKTKKAGKTEE